MLMLSSMFLSIWILYVATLMTPGANSLLICNVAMGDQAQKALFAALGVALGSGIWALLALLGVDVLFKMFPWLRIGLQILGALYLLYIATCIWRLGNPNISYIPKPALTSVMAFRMGILTNITNPKGVIFFGSIFAASLRADQGWATKLSAVAMIFLTSICWHMMLAYLFSRSKVQTVYGSNRGFISRGGALIIGVIAVYLAKNAIDGMI